MKPNNRSSIPLIDSINNFNKSKYLIDIKDINLIYVPDFLREEHADLALRILLSELDWQQPNIRIAGKQIAIPRKQAWLGDRAFRYTYSGQCFTAKSWHPEVLRIKQAIETELARHFNSAEFNSVLCNLYRDGQDSVSWHADNEPELGSDPLIASYSLGQARRFQFRLNADPSIKHHLDLNHNDLLIMGCGTQSNWQHQVPKSKKPMAPRINLTFRKIFD